MEYGIVRAQVLYDTYKSLYGHKKVAQQYPNQDGVAKIWAETLKSLSDSEFRNGMRRLNYQKTLPTIPEFLRLCKTVGEVPGEEGLYLGRGTAIAALTPPETGWELDTVYRTPDNAEDFDPRWGDRWYAHARQRLLKLITENGLHLRPEERGVLPDGRIGTVPDIAKRITDCFIKAAKMWADDCRSTWDRYIDTATGELVIRVGSDAIPDKKLADKWWNEMISDARETAEHIRSAYDR